MTTHRTTGPSFDWPRSFSEDYATARARFVEAAGGLLRESYENPQQGPQGQTLFVDTALVGAESAPRLLVMISGTHGVELFGGAGCQTGWLTDKDRSELPDDTAVLLIHALNPYGAAWRRRVNEDNVDINRNFVDHARPHFENPHYAEIHDWLVPGELEGPVREEARRKLAEYRRTAGEEAYQVGFLGQYSHADGFYYGGRAPCWSNQVLRRIIRGECAQRSALAVLDLHTGLGPFGYGIVGILAEAGSMDAQRAHGWYGESSTTFDEAGQASGYLDYRQFQEGFVLQAFNQELPEAKLALGGIEFGTYPVDEVTEAEIADAWLHNHPDAGADLANRIRAEMLRVYYPNTPDWQEMVWWRFRQVLRQTLTGLAEL